jgi:hypothetical protein
LALIQMQFKREARLSGPIPLSVPKTLNELYP